MEHKLRIKLANAKKSKTMPMFPIFSEKKALKVFFKLEKKAHNMMSLIFLPFLHNLISPFLVLITFLVILSIKNPELLATPLLRTSTLPLRFGCLPITYTPCSRQTDEMRKLKERAPGNPLLLLLSVVGWIAFVLRKHFSTCPTC